jgi:hypothetical protein
MCAPFVAAIGGGLLPALIAASVALVVALLMVLVPSLRRAGRSPASAAPSPPVSAFRAHPINDHSVAPVPSSPASADPPAVEPAPEAPEAAEPGEEQVEDPTPEAAQPILAGVAEPAALSHDPSAAADEPAAGAVAVADPPRTATEPPHPIGPRFTEPAPDLLAAFSPAVVLGDAFDSERLRRIAPDAAPVADLGPQTGARALLRDHSLVVPIAACVLIGVTVHVVRARRRRR